MESGSIINDQYHLNDIGCLGRDGGDTVCACARNPNYILITFTYPPFLINNSTFHLNVHN